MIDSATQEASVAATAASAALPPFARISAPAAVVAGFPAAIPGCIARADYFSVSATLRGDRKPRPCAFFLGGALGLRSPRTRGEHEPHQGREAGHHQGARPRGDGYRLAGSPDRKSVV